MFEDDKFYSDAQIAEIFAVSPGTVYNWKQDFGFPPGGLFGRLRRTSGQQVNDWIAKRPADKARLAPGMGGHGRGRPRKSLPPPAAA
jgi:hypothetical protein